jgi:hypothetical protein
MAVEWLVAAVVFVIGVMAAVAIYYMRSDAETRRYLPGIRGLFNFGRMRVHPDPDHERDKDKKDAWPSKQ